MSRKVAGAAAALVLYATLTVLFTWPLVLHPASRLLDDGNLDGFQFVWNLWWVREALVRSGMRGAVLAENATALAALPATCMVASLLVRELTGRPGIGVVAAVAL